MKSRVSQIIQIIGSSCTLFLLATYSHASIIANFISDYQPNTFPPGWQYLWNAPDGWSANGSNGNLDTGWLTQTSNYTSMVYAGSCWTADGDTNGNHAPDKFIRIKSNGGHPGATSGEGTNGFDRYAIIAYTVPSNGYYALVDSYIKKGNSNGDGIEAVVHINDDTPVRTASALPGQGKVDFDINLGYLNSNDTIYVCIGGINTANSDAYDMDFSIEKFDSPNDLRAILVDAISNGGSTVTVPSGYYRQTPDANNNGIHLSIENLSNKEIRMDGVRMICTEHNQALDLRLLTDITVRGLSIDYSPLQFAQFTITAIASDYSYYDMELIDGYLVNSLATEKGLHIFDPSTGITRKLRGDSTFTSLGNRKYRYTKMSGWSYDPSQDVEKIGDIVVINNVYQPSGYTSKSAIIVGKCANFELRQFKIYGANGSAIFEGNSSDTRYIEVECIPCPEGADYWRRSVKRYRSVNSDGFHLGRNTGSITLDSCKVNYSDDQGVNIFGKSNLIQDYTMPGVEGHSIVVVDSKNQLHIEEGDRVELVRFEGEHLGSAYVRSISNSGSPTASFLNWWNINMSNASVDFTPSVTWTIALEDEMGNLLAATGITPGTMIYGANRVANPFTITNCDFSHGRAAGIRVAGIGGSINNNIIEHRVRYAIMVKGAFNSLESAFPMDIDISNNQLSSTGSAAIFIGMEFKNNGDIRLPVTPGLYEDVRIFGGNSIRGVGKDIIMHGVDGWEISGNSYPGNGKQLDIQYCTNEY